MNKKDKNYLILQQQARDIFNDATLTGSSFYLTPSLKKLLDIPEDELLQKHFVNFMIACECNVNLALKEKECSSQTKAKGVDLFNLRDVYNNSLRCLSLTQNLYDTLVEIFGEENVRLTTPTISIGRLSDNTIRALEKEIPNDFSIFSNLDMSEVPYITFKYKELYFTLATYDNDLFTITFAVCSDENGKERYNHYLDGTNLLRIKPRIDKLIRDGVKWNKQEKEYRICNPKNDSMKTLFA